MPDVRFSCPSCRTTLEVPASLPAERLIECPRCRDTFRRNSAVAARATPTVRAEESWERSPASSANLGKIIAGVMVGGIALAAVGLAVVSAWEFEPSRDSVRTPLPQTNPRMMPKKGMPAGMPMGKGGMPPGFGPPGGIPPFMKKQKAKQLPPDDKTSWNLQSGQLLPAATMTVSPTRQRGFIIPSQARRANLDCS